MIVVLVVESSIGMGEVEGDGTMLGNNKEEEGGGETAGEGGWAGSDTWGAGGGETWGGNWSAGSCCRADCAVLEPGGDLRAL